MRKQKLLSFNFPNQESTDWMFKILECAAAANWEIFWTDFFGDQLFPYEYLSQIDCHYQVLLERSVDSALRLTAEQYQTLCGNDIDFLRIATHEQLVNGLPIDEASLSAEGIPRQRLRGVAFKLEQHLMSVSPDFVLVPQGALTVSRLALAKCKKLNIPVALRESPFFPGYCLVDTMGMHFYPGESEIAHRWSLFSEKELDEHQAEIVGEFLNQWMESRQSKYLLADSQQEMERVSSEVQAARRQGKRILLYPGQLDADASVLYGLGVFHSLADFESCLLSSLTDDTHLLVKHHPFATTLRDMNHDRVSVCQQIGIHDLIQLSDAVVTFSSNVGLEALLYGKPVVCGGRPHYSGKGLTIDVMSREHLAGCLEASRNFLPNGQLRDRYLHYMLSDYLFQEGDPTGFTRKAKLAGCAKAMDTQPEAPFRDQADSQLAAYVELANSYEALSRHNLTHEEIRTRLADRIPANSCTLHSSKAADLKSGERQWGLSFQDIEPGHLARYSLAAKLLPESGQVLDIACGTGYGSFLMAEQMPVNVTAVDASAEAVDFASKHWHHRSIEYVNKSCGTIFQGASREFDAIVCLETIEHLVNPQRFLQDCWRSLSSQGVMVLSVPHSSVFPLANTEFHVQHFSEASLRNMLGAFQPKFVAVLGQLGPRISTRLDQAKFLICIAAKTDLQHVLRPLIPFELDRVPERSEYEIPSSLFTSPAGEMGPQGLTLPADMEEGFAFFGPYFTFPAGWYRVQFHFTDGRCSNDRTRLDVAYCTGKVLAQGYAADLRDQALVFHNVQPDLQLEFRAFVEGSGESQTSQFTGVTLRSCPAPGHPHMPVPHLPSPAIQNVPLNSP